MSEIDRDALALVSGGLNTSQMTPSTNVEDRRGWSRRRSMNAPVTYLPTPKWHHEPGDLADQAGYNSIGPLAKRLRAESRRRRR